MCDVVGGVPGCVTKCGRGKGGQNWPKIAWRTLWTAPKGGAGSGDLKPSKVGPCWSTVRKWSVQQWLW